MKVPPLSVPHHCPGPLKHSLLAATMIMLSALSAGAYPSSAEQIDSLKHAVVVITTYDAQGRLLLQGSGFFIATDRIVTNVHVISAANEIRVQTFTGNNLTVQKVLAIDADYDLAILLVKDSHTASILNIETSIPAQGESIILLSNPQGAPWKVSHGSVGRLWRFEKLGRRIQITAGVFPGSSGGPVLNERGQVVGIAVMRLDGTDDLNFAVPADKLKALQASIHKSNR